MPLSSSWQEHLPFLANLSSESQYPQVLDVYTDWLEDRAGFHSEAAVIRSFLTRFVFQRQLDQLAEGIGLLLARLGGEWLTYRRCEFHDPSFCSSPLHSTLSFGVERPRKMTCRRLTEHFGFLLIPLKAELLELATDANREWLKIFVGYRMYRSGHELQIHLPMPLLPVLKSFLQRLVDERQTAEVRAGEESTPPGDVREILLEMLSKRRRKRKPRNA